MKQKNILILLIPVFLAVLGVGLVAGYMLSTDTFIYNSNTNPNAGQQNSTLDPENNKQVEENSDNAEPTANSFFNYVWYEDDYVKFQYPEGAQIEVTVPDEAKSAQVNKGLATLEIELNDGSYLELDSFPGGGEGSWTIDINSKKLYMDILGNETPPQNIESEIFISYVESLDRYLIVFEAPFLSEDIRQITSPVTAEGNGVYEGLIGSGDMFVELDVEGINSYMINGFWLDVNCNSENQESVDKCAEFVNTFFESVERVDSDTTKAATISDYIYDATNNAILCNPDGKTNFKVQPGWECNTLQTDAALYGYEIDAQDFSVYFSIQPGPNSKRCDMMDKFTDKVIIWSDDYCVIEEYDETSNQEVIIGALSRDIEVETAVFIEVIYSENKLGSYVKSPRDFS
jgi:hypothetical protein